MIFAAVILRTAVETASILAESANARQVHGRVAGTAALTEAIAALSPYNASSDARRKIPSLTPTDLKSQIAELEYRLEDLEKTRATSRAASSLAEMWKIVENCEHLRKSAGICGNLRKSSEIW